MHNCTTVCFVNQIYPIYSLVLRRSKVMLPYLPCQNTLQQLLFRHRVGTPVWSGPPMPQALCGNVPSGTLPETNGTSLPYAPNTLQQLPFRHPYHPPSIVRQLSFRHSAGRKRYTLAATFFPARCRKEPVLSLLPSSAGTSPGGHPAPLPDSQVSSPRSWRYAMSLSFPKFVGDINGDAMYSNNF